MGLLRHPCFGPLHVYRVRSVQLLFESLQTGSPQATAPGSGQKPGAEPQAAGSAGHLGCSYVSGPSKLNGEASVVTHMIPVCFHALAV